MSLLRKKCCCGCTSCCFRFTFTGDPFLNFNPALAADYSGGDGFGRDPGYDAEITTTEGSLAAITFCGTASGAGFASANLPYAVRIEYTQTAGWGETLDPYNECGYLQIVWSEVYDTNKMDVWVAVPIGTDTFREVFRTTVTLTSNMLTVINTPGTQCSVANGESASGSNTLTLAAHNDTPFTSGDGGVTVELVDACDHTDWSPNCATSGGFAQTICDEDDCPCGRTDAQPECTQVVLQDLDGIDATYQGGAIVDGQDDRNYIFSGPYLRADETWWRFVVVVDDPTAPVWGNDAAYFEHQCPGDNLDSYSGTYTYADAADWSGTVTGTTLTSHQTALTNIGTSIVVTDCACADAEDVYALDVECDGVGTSPSGWSDLTLERNIGSCTWEDVGATYSATLVFLDGSWTLTVTRNSDSAVMLTTTWVANGSDPTGTHYYLSGLWDEDCVGLAGVIA